MALGIEPPHGGQVEVFDHGAAADPIAQIDRAAGGAGGGGLDTAEEEAGALQPRPFQAGASQVGAGQVGIAEVGQVEITTAQVGAVEINAAQVRAAQVGPLEHVLQPDHRNATEPVFLVITLAIKNRPTQSVVTAQGGKQAGIGKKTQDAGLAFAVDAANHRRQSPFGQHALQGPILQHSLFIADQFRDAVDEAIDRLGLGDAVLLGGQALIHHHLSPGNQQRYKGHQDLAEGAHHPLADGTYGLPIARAEQVQKRLQPAQAQRNRHRRNH